MAGAILMVITRRATIVDVDVINIEVYVDDVNGAQTDAGRDDGSGGIMMDSSTLRREFWLLWVVASGLGGAVVAAVTRAAAYAVGYAVSGAVDGTAGYVVGEAALGIVALGGFMGAIGIAQWLVMLRQFSWAGWWVLASVVGGAVGGAVLLGLMAALSAIAGETVSAITAVVAGLTALGITQWVVIRRQVAFASWLALASVAGLVAAGPLGGGLVGALTGSEVASGFGFGAVYGAITGGALVNLSGRAATTAADPA